MFSKSSRKCDYNLHVVFESCVFKSNVQRIKQFIKEQLKLHNISYGGGGGVGGIESIPLKPPRFGCHSRHQYFHVNFL